jgi:L-threonylcarbamoyladenylate synthase
VAHVLAGLEGRIAAVIESGPCRVGVESTVVDLTGAVPFLLRPGGVNLEALEASIGKIGRGITPGQAEQNRVLRSPGLLVSHYAPVLPVRLNAVAVREGEALLAFGPPVPGAKLVFQLSEARNLNEAAARLFEGLHWLDARAGQGISGIAVMAIPDDGLGLAMNDRLTRAAAPR